MENMSNISCTKELSTKVKEKSIRKGVWTQQEKDYALKLVQIFKAGYLENVANGTSLRSFLAQELNCEPMRITKKFKGSTAIRSQRYNPYTRPQNGQANQEKKNLFIQLRALKQSFLQKLNEQSTNFTSIKKLGSCCKDPFKQKKNENTCILPAQSNSCNIMEKENATSQVHNNLPSVLSYPSDWSDEEVDYASKLIELFQAGMLLNIENGTTLKHYLAQKLLRDPNGVARRYFDNIYLKNQSYRINHSLVTLINNENTSVLQPYISLLRILKGLRNKYLKIIGVYHSSAMRSQCKQALQLPKTKTNKYTHKIDCMATLFKNYSSMGDEAIKKEVYTPLNAFDNNAHSEVSNIEMATGKLLLKQRILRDCNVMSNNEEISISSFNEKYSLVKATLEADASSITHRRAANLMLSCKNDAEMLLYFSFVAHSGIDQRNC